MSQPINNTGENAIDPEILKFAEETFKDIRERLPLNGRDIGPYSYFLDGVKIAWEHFTKG